MPTYSYKCTECGTAFDIQQAFTDDTLTECPNCHGRLRKVFTPVGVTFTGSGFYRNDSKATPGKPKSADSKSSDSNSSDSNSSDSKAAGSSDSGSSSSGSSAPTPTTPAAPSTPAAG